MMQKILNNAFPTGHRKVSMALLVLTIGCVMDKWGGGLSNHLTQLLILVLGVFTGGNVLNGFSDALGKKKKSKDEPGSAGVELAPPPSTSSAEVEALRGEIFAALTQFDQRLASMGSQLDQLGRQTQIHQNNITQIVGILNEQTSKPKAPPVPNFKPASLG